MEFLWSPWRYHYVATAETVSACIFCQAPQREDHEAYILFRGQESFVIMNLFPYTTAHLMIAPYMHVPSPTDAPKPVTDEMMDLAKRCLTILEQVYHPHGYNLGMNLGRAAGAGVADHFHLHVLPRWNGDTNFMTTIGETRVLPEDLATTYTKLKPLF